MSEVKQKNVVLLGDSTLDNYHWVMPDDAATVTAQLNAKLGEGEHVFNLAMDGFTSRDVLLGAIKNKAVADDRHPLEPFYPMDELVKIQQPSHIVLSVGGNDIRESLLQLITSKPEDRERKLQELLRGLQDNYIRIIEKIKAARPDANIIIMLQYTPSLQPDYYLIYYLMQQMAEHRSIKENLFTYLDILVYRLLGRSMAVADAAVKQVHAIMETAYAPIIDYARKNRIPVIDTATTFDHTNNALYKMQIEPSQQGGALIAEMISHVMENHDFTGPSVLYVKPGCTSGAVLSVEGDLHWRPHAIPMDHPHRVKPGYLLNQTQNSITNCFQYI